MIYYQSFYTKDSLKFPKIRFRITLLLQKKRGDHGKCIILYILYYYYINSIKLFAMIIIKR